MNTYHIDPGGNSEEANERLMSMHSHPQTASGAWFSLWSAGSPSPPRSASPRWPAVRAKQDV